MHEYSERLVPAYGNFNTAANSGQINPEPIHKRQEIAEQILSRFAAVDCTLETPKS